MVRQSRPRRDPTTILLLGSAVVAVAFLSELPIGWSYSIGLPIVLLTCTLLHGGPGFTPVLRFSMVALGVCAATWLFDIHGLFCVAVLLVTLLLIAALAALPVALLITICSWASTKEKQAEPSHRKRLQSLLPLLLVPVACVESAFRSQAPIVTHTTKCIVQQPPQTAWANLRFYDELEHTPPLLFHLGLPRPRHTVGELAPGLVQTCVYDKGSLRKVCSKLEVNRTIEFTVLDQAIGFERSCRLRRGSFHVEAADAETTLLTVTTEYTALLRPRWLFAPVEASVVSSLHHYLIEGIETQEDGQANNTHLAQNQSDDD